MAIEGRSIFQAKVTRVTSKAPTARSPRGFDSSSFLIEHNQHGFSHLRKSEESRYTALITNSLTLELLHVFQTILLGYSSGELIGKGISLGKIY